MGISTPKIVVFLLYIFQKFLENNMKVKLYVTLFRKIIQITKVLDNNND